MEHLMKPATIAIFDNLSVALGERTLLDNQDLSVERGTITVLMGPSDVGMSVLADVAFGLEKRHGALQVDGVVGEVRTEGALVFQGGSGLGHLTVLDNLLLVSSNEQDCLRLVEEFELDPRKLAVHLSRDERWRLAVASSSLAERRFLWLDEPDAGLDPARLLDLATTLKRRVAESDLSVIVVTHNLSFAEEITDRILFLRPDGRLSDSENFRGSSRALMQYSPRLQSRLRRLFANLDVVNWTIMFAASFMFIIESIRHRQARLTFSHAFLLAGRGVVYYPLIGFLIGAMFLIILIRTALPLFDAAAIVREFGPEIVLRVSPPITAILVALCAGSTIAVWVGQLTVGRQLDTLLVMGVPTLRCVLGPILWAISLTTVIGTLTFSLSIGAVFGMYVQLTDGNAAAVDFLVRIAEYDSLVLLSMLKAIAYGFLIGGNIVGSATANTLRSPGDLGAAVTRGITWSTIAIILVELVAASAYGWIAP